MKQKTLCPQCPEGSPMGCSSFVPSSLPAAIFNALAHQKWRLEVGWGQDYSVHTANLINNDTQQEANTQMA